MSLMTLFHAVDTALAARAEGCTVQVHILIPLVSVDAELDTAVRIINETAAIEFLRLDSSISYSLGVMIEVPRAMVRARYIAAQVTNTATATATAIAASQY
jgi:phosphoenolpyruvate-protein kinase (PTS system EI component)